VLAETEPSLEAAARPAHLLGATDRPRPPSHQRQRGNLSLLVVALAGFPLAVAAGLVSAALALLVSLPSTLVGSAGCLRALRAGGIAAVR
jgi:hypothetical protein